mgnify:CR=1 FL=1
MKYAVLTTKHHEGFCLFDSQYTDYKSTNTPCGKDLVREYVDAFRAEGLKVGLLRPITLYPFPKKQLAEMAARGVKGFLSAELNAGQMVEDVRLAVNGKAPVEHYGRQGGMMFNPDEVLDALKEKLIKK